MAPVGQDDVEGLLASAKTGKAESLNELLQLYGNYLRVVAGVRLDDRLRSRCSPSDVVQDTLLDAYRDFPRFRGRTKAEFLGWLRQILANNILRLTERHIDAAKRAVRREVSLDAVQGASRSSASLGAILADRAASPSSIVGGREAAGILVDQLDNLPPDYREVLVLRHFHGLSFAEVGERMRRSPGAVRILWVRAIGHMQRILENRGLA
jgi:RNA polymerase sigma-70 factor (ECF subfamily)